MLSLLITCGLQALKPSHVCLLGMCQITLVTALYSEMCCPILYYIAVNYVVSTDCTIQQKISLNTPSNSDVTKTGSKHTQIKRV